MSKKILALLAIVIMLLSGCKYFQSEDSADMITGEIIEILPSEEDEVIELEEGEEIVVEIVEDPELEEQAEEDFSDILIRVEGTEGDLMSLKPDAYDPDGDVIIYTFTEPFNENGEWQTQEGDEGRYAITITASDGRLSTSEEVLIVILPTNKAPVIECEDELSLTEGELVDIDCKIYDPEKADITIAYTGWMEGTKYQTGYADAGEHEVVVSANDGERTTTKTIRVLVANLNRAPEVESFDTINAEEEDLVELNVVASDPDGEELSFEYTEPFNGEGQWQTALGDAGTYDASVTVTDGEGATKVDFQVVVSLKNTAPTLEFIPSIMVDEGDSINLPINAYDREGDELILTISGWMESDSYTTTYQDQGEHTVTVTVSDGKLESSQDVEIIVNDVNRAPVFKIPA